MNVQLLWRILLRQELMNVYIFVVLVVLHVLATYCRTDLMFELNRRILVRVHLGTSPHVVDFFKAFDCLIVKCCGNSSDSTGSQPDWSEWFRNLMGERPAGLPGVHQERLLSPFLFLLATDWVLRQVTDGKENGIQWTPWFQLGLLSHIRHQIHDRTSILASFASKVGLTVQPEDQDPEDQLTSQSQWS